MMEPEMLGGSELSMEELEIISSQGGKGVLRLELKSGRAVRFLANGSSVDVEGVFPQNFIDAGIICPESVQSINDFCASVMALKPADKCEIWLNAPDGHRRWCVLEYTLLSNHGGEPEYALITIRDETELHERTLAYEKWRESLLSMFAENASYAEFNLSSGLMERQMGMPANSSLAGRSSTIREYVDYACENQIVEEDRDDYREFFDRERLLSLFERGVTEDTLEYRDVVGGVHWMRASVKMTRFPGAGEIKAFIVYNNIDRQRSELERLARLASRDSLTNILNRKALEDRITERLSNADEDELSALYIIDLDNFKQINDRFGHQAGDETLKSVASALNNTFRSGDIVGRLGGDEFMAFISGVSERNAISRADRLLNELQFFVEDASLSASVGLALCVGKADFSELYHDADIALYKSKNMGKNRCTVHRHDEQRRQIPEEADPTRESRMIQLQTLLEYMDGGVIIVEVMDDDVNEVYVSPSYYSTIRHAPGKKIEHGRMLFDGIVGTHREEVLRTLNYTAKTGMPSDSIYQVIAEDGVEWHHLRAARLPGTEATPRIIGVVTDVTELKRSTSQLEAIAAYSTVGIAMFELSEQGTAATFVNPRLELMTGLSQKQLNERPDVLESLLGGHKLKDIAGTSFSTDSGEGTFEFVCAGADISDSPECLYIQARGARIYDTAESTVLLVMYTDITRERAMEEQLRMAEERYRIAAAQTGMNIWEVDISTRTMRQLDASDSGAGAAETVYSDVPQSLLDCGLVHPDSEQVLRAMFSDIFAGREGEDYILRRRDKSGVYVWARSRYTLVHGADGSICHAVGVSEVMPNIDADLRELRRTWQFSGMIEDLLLVTFHVNVTRDIVDYVHMNGVQTVEPSGIKCFDDCRRLLRSVMADCEENRELLESLTAEWLIGLHRDGRRIYMYEFRSDINGCSGWCNLFFDIIRDPLSGDVWVFGYLRDISKKRITESLLKQKASYDTVTRLYSYATVRGAMDAVISQLEPESTVVVSVLDLMGLDTLKSVRGMSAANRVLDLVGRLFRLLIGDTAVFGHLTQNRFIVLHYDVTSVEDWRAMMLQMLDRANELMHRSDVDSTVRFVCGYVHSVTKDADFGVLIRKASIACRAALGGAMAIAQYSDIELEGLGDDIDTAEVERDHSPEMAALTRKYHALEVSYQQLANQLMASDYDNTTGLFSYSAFLRAVQERMDDDPAGFDIVTFEVRNYNLYCGVNGIQAGDRIVCMLGETLKNFSALVARADSSRLVALLSGDIDIGSVVRIMCERMAEHSSVFELSVSAGVYTACGTERHVAHMCDCAMEAMKTAPDGEIAVFDPERHGPDNADRNLTADLQKAVDEGQLKVLFRPRRSSKSGSVVGAGASVYWDHPDKGMIGAGAFVRLYERCGLSDILCEFVADQCCRFVSRWQTANGEPIPVSLAPDETGVDIVRVPDFVKVLAHLADRCNIDRKMIVPEISEKAYLENSGKLAKLVEEYHSHGFRIGIESFGSGCSPVNLLMDIPVDSLRLDAGFIRRNLENQRGKYILAALLNAAGQMGVEVVASGVDDKGCAQALDQLGECSIQGGYVSEPMSTEVFLELAEPAGLDSVAAYNRCCSLGDEREPIQDSFSGVLMGCFDEVCQIDFVARTITVRSSAYRCLLGIAHPLDETIERLCRSSVAPEDVDKLRDYIDRAADISDGQHLAVSYRIKGRDGLIHCVYSRAVYISSGNCLLCNTDITGRMHEADQREQERLRVQMRQERENYYSMVERLGSTIVEWDLTDGTCWSSDSCARYAINTGSRLNTGGVMDSGVYDDDMVSFAMFMSRLESGADHADTTLRMKMADGTYRWTRLNGEAVRGSDNIPVRMLVSLTDVDDDYHNRLKIEGFNARSDAFIENIPSGVLIARIEGGVITGQANRHLCSLMGYTAEQIIDMLHRHWTDIVAPGDRVWIASEIKHLLKGKQKQIDVICSMRHRKGYDVPIRVLGALISQEDDSVTIAFICVSEQLESE